MKVPLLVRVLTLFSLLLTRDARGDSPSVHATSGVIVEKVERGGEGENSELKVSDHILAWSSGATHGKMESPFDWNDLLNEQSPRGHVVLLGTHAGQTKTWSLGLRIWGVTVEPNLSPRRMASLRSCRRLSTSKKYLEAERCWSAVLKDITVNEPRWLPPLLIIHIAESLAELGRWPEADRMYREAVERSRPAQQKITAQILESWGVAAWFHGDLAQASEHCTNALAIREALAPDSLVVAKVLSDFGDVAQDHEDFSKAEEFYLKAMAIRDRLAPD